MARMWPVAIMNELDTFCGFIVFPQEHARGGYKLAAWCACRVVPRFANPPMCLKAQSAHYWFLGLGGWGEERKEKPSQRGGCPPDSKLWMLPVRQLRARTPG